MHPSCLGKEKQEPLTKLGADSRASRCTEDEMEKYDIHLLALAHVYSVPQLKQRCIRGLIQRLTLHNVVDVLQLSRLCNAPDLHLRCMKLVYNNFHAVEETEGWKFLQDHDPHLELDVLQFIDEAESVSLLGFYLHACMCVCICIYKTRKNLKLYSL